MYVIQHMLIAVCASVRVALTSIAKVPGSCCDNLANRRLIFCVICCHKNQQQQHSKEHGSDYSPLFSLFVPNSAHMAKAGNTLNSLPVCLGFDPGPSFCEVTVLFTDAL